MNSNTHTHQGAIVTIINEMGELETPRRRVDGGGTFEKKKRRTCCDVLMYAVRGTHTHLCARWSLSRWEAEEEEENPPTSCRLCAIVPLAAQVTKTLNDSHLLLRLCSIFYSKLEFSGGKKKKVPTMQFNKSESLNAFSHLCRHDANILH